MQVGTKPKPRRARQPEMAVALVAGTWIFVTGCYSLSKAGDFPCAQDRSCPEGYSCRQKVCLPTFTGGESAQMCYGMPFQGASVSNAGLVGSDRLSGYCTFKCSLTSDCPGGLFCEPSLGGSSASLCFDCGTSDDCPVSQCCAAAFTGSLLSARFGCQDFSALNAANAAATQSSAGTNSTVFRCL